jgi:hypothetical protein
VSYGTPGLRGAESYAEVWLFLKGSPAASGEEQSFQ